MTVYSQPNQRIWALHELPPEANPTWYVLLAKGRCFAGTVLSAFSWSSGRICKCPWNAAKFDSARGTLAQGASPAALDVFSGRLDLVAKTFCCDPGELGSIPSSITDTMGKSLHHSASIT